MKRDLSHGPIVSAGILLGTGLGGFVDGIVLHQILQWHNMLSSVHPPVDLVSMKYNMVWDGLFHAFTWLMTVAGLTRLWLAGQRPDVAWSTRTFGGSLLIGWGLFNFIEGVIDHHLLGVHHVHPGTGSSHGTSASSRRASSCLPPGPRSCMRAVAKVPIRAAASRARSNALA